MMKKDCIAHRTCFWMGRVALHAEVATVALRFTATCHSHRCCCNPYCRSHLSSFPAVPSHLLSSPFCLPKCSVRHLAWTWQDETGAGWAAWPDLKVQFKSKCWALPSWVPGITWNWILSSFQEQIREPSLEFGVCRAIVHAAPESPQLSGAIPPARWLWCKSAWRPSKHTLDCAQIW